jgi:hypothetical protein
MQLYEGNSKKFTQYKYLSFGFKNRKLSSLIKRLNLGKIM